MKIKRFVEASFPDIHDDTHVISVYSVLQSQCEAHGSLRTVAKQFFAKQRTFVTCLLYQHSQYIAFYRPNKTEVMIITPGKSVTMGDLRFQKLM